MTKSSSLGPALAATPVLISALGLMWSWQQDRQITVRTQAQEFRTVAAPTVATLDRVEVFSTLLFDISDCNIKVIERCPKT